MINLETQKTRTIPLNDIEVPSARRGEQLFHSANVTQFGQFSCASCHPNGGSDGLQWDLTRNGIGNFMNTRSLQGVGVTGPYGWHGESETLSDRITGTLRHLHRHEPTRQQVTDLVQYLKSLPAPKGMVFSAGKNEVVKRGKLLFEGKAKCSRCHVGPTFQDGETHNVGTSLMRDLKSKFDTPSLRGISKTAPYLHHGKANTLSAIFREYNRAEKHGAAHTLSKQEFTELIAYLNSL